MGALGVAAIAFMSRMVLIVIDEGAVVLQAWFSQPPPVTKKWMLGPALVHWLRTREQLVDCECAPSEVACRLSLFHLVSKIPELIPEIADHRGLARGCWRWRYSGEHACRPRARERRGLQLGEADATRGREYVFFWCR